MTNFNRRQFITSTGLGSLGLILLDSVSSFSKAIEQTDDRRKTGLLFYKDSKGRKRRVTILSEWRIKRQQIHEGMEQAMGKLPDFSNLPDMNIQVIDETKEEKYVRQNISFIVAEDERVPALLYIPNRRNSLEKVPAMLALHETDPIGKKSVDGQGHNINLAYAKELAQRGYVVIAPDNPGFGGLEDYDFKADRYQSGTMKSIFDNMRCVDLLQARTDVDSDRIGVIGHSLGGHNAIFTGAFDERLKVIVSSCGWTLFDYDNLKEAADYIKRFGGRLGDWAQEQYMPLLSEKYNLDPEKIPFDFDEAIAAIAPRAFFSNSPLHDADFNANGVKAGIAEIVKVYRFLNKVDQLEVRYPNSKHDFPDAVRMKSYQFIDKTFAYNQG